MGVNVKKRLVLVLTVAAVISAGVTTPSFAGGKKAIAKATSNISICKSTSAVGHSPKKLPIPAVNVPHVNRTFTFTTNCGDIVIDADGVNAPLTVIALSYLAKNGYYDQSLCHRLVTSGIYILQCGDPTASGQGGPRFYIPDENLPPASSNAYPAGTVAMANAGAGTNGSQFFITYQDNSQLSSNYTVWGHVTKGLDIVKAVAAAGNASDGVGPAQVIAIEKVKVK